MVKYYLLKKLYKYEALNTGQAYFSLLPLKYNKQIYYKWFTCISVS